MFTIAYMCLFIDSYSKSECKYKEEIQKKKTGVEIYPFYNPDLIKLLVFLSMILSQKLPISYAETSDFLSNLAFC